jgi:hypothetical protein
MAFGFAHLNVHRTPVRRATIKLLPDLYLIKPGFTIAVKHTREEKLPLLICEEYINHQVDIF